MNKSLLIPAVLASALFAPIQTQAATANETWHDNSYEIVLDSSGNLATTLAVGDILVGVVGITSYGPGTNPVTQNLTAIYATEVTGVTSYGGSSGPCNGAETSLTSCSGFTFSAVTGNVGSFGSGYEGAINAVYSAFGLSAPTLSNLDANSVITWFDNPNQISTSNIITDTLSSASTGTQVSTMDLLAGNYWTANGPTDTLQGAILPASTAIGNYAFSVTQTYSDYPYASYLPNTIFTGNGTIASGGGDGLTTFAVNDQANISSYVVPEPSILALLGIGLLGFGAAKNNRRQLQAV